MVRREFGLACIARSPNRCHAARSSRLTGRPLPRLCFVRACGRRRLGGNPRGARVLHCVPVPGATQASLGMPQAPARHDLARAGGGIGLRRTSKRISIMATIGTVTKHDDGHYEGELRTLSVRADIAILPVTDKASHNQPDFRVLSKGVEIGAGWLRMGQMSGKEYVSLSISAPEF